MKRAEYRLPTVKLPIHKIEALARRADRPRVAAFWALFSAEIETAQELERKVLETWVPEHQSAADAERILCVVRNCREQFDNLCIVASGYQLDRDTDENFHQAAAYARDIYHGVLRVAEDNLRVAQGIGRLRHGGHPEEFIGPTRGRDIFF